MKITKLSLIAAGLVLSTSILAGNHALRSSSILIPGAVLTPHETLTIPTDKLMNDVSYDVVCKIKDPNNSKNPAYIKISGSGCGSYINGASIYNQAKLDQVNNLLELVYVTNYSPISITNLDNDDTIEVEGCVATPSAW